ncbi:MAG: hypothetical protein ONB46_10050 [candidate division KSB1 bacterium]|nr:hypothetical protein [candidate division KSB1 bacterium]MDZ7366146.1 hypothetical protein [candidate division KSB1 bacterium]MDZ7404212.1 hypothetical protein [candidate division KSB1 bacterium]
MKSFHWFRQSIFAVGLSGSLLFLSSCEQNPSPAKLSPIQPTGVAPTNSLAKKGAAKPQKRLKKKEKSCESGSVSKIMGEKGGALKLCDYAMEVPPGALKEEREMSITIIDNADNYYEVDLKPRVVDFGADGWFHKPVKIIIFLDKADLTGIDPETLTVVWYDEAAGEWVETDGDVEVKKNRIVAYVWHFTQYSIAMR